jgi:uncharacterized protein (TIGR02001 family)
MRSGCSACSSVGDACPSAEQAGLHRVGPDRDGLHVPQHLKHESGSHSAGRIRCDLRHVLGLYLGSNTAFADVELDYGAGISPQWKDNTFSICGLCYTFPGGSFQNYFELKTGATWASGAWSIGVNNYWSPDNFQLYGESDAIEGAVGYTFASKLFNFFTPTLSGTLGFQSFDKVASDYTYWNAGLTLGFLDHWSADVRYYDTSYSKTECAQYFGVPGTRSDCDARVVGAIKATF